MVTGPYGSASVILGRANGFICIEGKKNPYISAFYRACGEGWFFCDESVKIHSNEREFFGRISAHGVLLIITFPQR